METISSTMKLPRSLPEEQGVASTAVINFLQAVEQHNLGLHSFMLLRHSHVIAEGWWSPYAPELPHMLFSLSKSFTATAIGLAADERLLSLEDKVISFFPDDLPPEISPNLAQMDISHLLMMGTGHVEDTTEHLHRSADGNWVKAFLSLPVDKEPGTHFVYNTGATYMLSAIVHKVSGLTLLEYLEPRLFTPLGIKNPAWESCPRGINTGGYGLSITTEDIAKFGQLYLQKGVWNNTSLLSKEWVAAASSIQIENGDGSDTNSDWSQGYGYQFWQCRHGVYRGDGAFGQFCIVMPDQDAVVAITSGTGDMQGVMNAVWDHLLPAMRDESSDQTHPDSTPELAGKLSSLNILPPAEQASGREESVTARLYMLEENILKLRDLSISFDGNEAQLTLHIADSEQKVLLGRNKWQSSRARILEGDYNRIMSSFTWLAEDKLLITMLFIETPFSLAFEIQYNEDSIVLSQRMNVSFGGDDPVILTGHLQ